MSKHSPRVSVLTISRNSEDTIGRCLQSIVEQSYSNLEIIVLDGSSTDRTQEIVRGFGDSVRLIIEEPTGADDAMFRGLTHCSGDYVTLCWADEGLLPGTVHWGVGNLLNHPNLAAVYGDVYTTDRLGKIVSMDILGRTPAWELEKFLCWEMLPSYCGSFFRLDILREVGFFDHRRGQDCPMYDYYAKVGLRHPIKYFPGAVGKFAEGGSSSTAKGLVPLTRLATSSITNLFDNYEMPNEIRALKGRALSGVYLAMLPNFVLVDGGLEHMQPFIIEALQRSPCAWRFDSIIHEISRSCMTAVQISRLLYLIRIMQASGHTSNILEAYAVACEKSLGNAQAA